MGNWRCHGLVADVTGKEVRVVEFGLSAVDCVVYMHIVIVCVQMKVGFVNTFIDIAVLQLAINTWGDAYFNFAVVPDWVKTTTLTPPVSSTTVMANVTMPSIVATLAP